MRVNKPQTNPAEDRQLTARVVGRVMLFLLGLVSLGAGANPGPAPASSHPAHATVSVDIVGDLPKLRVLRRAQIMVRVVNRTSQRIPDKGPEDYDRGPLFLYLGVWFADDRPSVLGTFEITHRVSAPLLAGQTVDIPVTIRPSVSGRRFLGIGLLQASGRAADYGQVGDTNAVAVDIEPGVWHENHRVALLKGIAFLHLCAFLIAATILLAGALRS